MRARLRKKIDKKWEAKYPTPKSILVNKWIPDSTFTFIPGVETQQVGDGVYKHKFGTSK